MLSLKKLKHLKKSEKVCHCSRSSLICLTSCNALFGLGRFCLCARGCLPTCCARPVTNRLTVWKRCVTHVHCLEVCRIFRCLTRFMARSLHIEGSTMGMRTECIISTCRRRLSSWGCSPALIRLFGTLLNTVANKTMRCGRFGSIKRWRWSWWQRWRWRRQWKWGKWCRGGCS